MKQCILILCCSERAVDAPVVAWALYDTEHHSTGLSMDDQPPYRSPFEAMSDDWRVIQMGASSGPAEAAAWYEFIMERIAP